MHAIYMQQAIQLAIQGQGYCAPNPLVGCIFVKDNGIVGQGYHHAYGAAHAERDALKNTQNRDIKGATAYITLEPCSHYGKQPPCVDALIEAGVKHVVFPFCDPDPKVSGQGLKKLQQAGIKITLGVAVEDSFNLIQDFIKHRITALPLVRAKWAMSLDGKIATHTGDSRWISSSASRRHAHLLRHQSQAILVGAHTLRTDNPMLNVRLDMDNPSHPIPVVVVGKEGLPNDAYIFRNPKTIIITPHDYPHQLPPNITHLSLKSDDNGYVSAKDILAVLGNKNIISLLIEGGGQLFAGFMQQNLIDEYHVFIAPKLIGGRGAPTAFGGQGFAQMVQAQKLHLLSQTIIEPDIYLQYESQAFTNWKKEQIACLQA